MLSTSGLTAAVAPNGVVTSCATGGHEPGVAWDPVDHRVYVSNFGAGTVSVLKGTCSIVGTIRLPNFGAQPFGIAFDPSNDWVYVVDSALDQVYAIDGTKLVATVTGNFSYPVGIAYDPAAGIMLVTNWAPAKGYITTINGTSANRTIAVGGQPVGISYDPFYNVVLVANELSDNITFINASSPSTPHHRSLAVGTRPYSIAFDPSDGDDYVSNGVGNNVTVFTGAGVHVGSVVVGRYPAGLVYSPSSLSVYVAVAHDNSVSVVHGLTVTSKVRLGRGADPSWLAYDDRNNDVFVAGYLSGTIYVLS